MREDTAERLQGFIIFILSISNFEDYFLDCFVNETTENSEKCPP